ncbi:MAG: phytoene desaturase family protein [Sediminibacterium sp.]
MQSNPKAVMIGAGVAGLAGAIRLALQGFEVMVFEKNEGPGGKMGQLVLNGYRFDTGPSLFTQPQLLEELFELAGEPIADYLTYRSLPVSCQYFYEDGTVINAYTNTGDFARELAEKTGEHPERLPGYLKRAKKIYDHIGQLFLNYSLHKRSTLVKAPVLKALLTVRWSYLFRSLHQVNARHFTTAKAVQLFNRYATYNGSDPYRAPGMLRLIPHLEHNEGVYYPEGGMISITHALYALALKKGVQFHFGTSVQSIIRHKNKVKGVVVSEENVYSDVVVSNTDVYFTYKHLLHDEQRAAKVLKQERSSSAMIFYWGIGKAFPQLQLHNIFFSEDYKAEFDHLFKQKKMFGDPTVYVNITSKCEPGVQAPHGKENWFVMVNMAANTAQDWETCRRQTRSAIIQKLNRILQTDIAPLIEAEDILDPLLIESKTASFGGSLYGTSSNARIAAFLRHPNFTNAIRGLYFVGGSVHPGGGIPLCLQSAKIMSDIVKEDSPKLFRH